MTGQRGGDDGSTVPLILGFFVLAFLLVAGSIAASDAYLDQRALQSACDGAALAGVNAIDQQIAFTGGVGPYQSVPLGPARDAAQAYLDRDASRSGVRIQRSTVTGGTTLTLECVETSPLAFGSVFGYGDGVQHRTTASARADFRG